MRVPLVKYLIAQAGTDSQFDWAKKRSRKAVIPAGIDRTFQMALRTASSRDDVAKRGL